MTNSVALVVSDVDGTLITPEHDITPRAKRAVMCLKDRGIGFTIASSRPPRGLGTIVKCLGITIPFAPFNGAQLVSPNDTILEEQHIPVARIERVRALGDEYRLNLWTYRGWEWFAQRRDEFVDQEEHTVGFQARIAEQIADYFENCPKVTVVGRPEAVTLCAQRIRAELETELSATQSQPRFVDITIRGATKGTVITSLSRILRIPTPQIAAIGDGPNDVEMFERAGISIAMGNSSEITKKAAKYITGSNTEEGFATGIERFILKDAKRAGE